MAVSHATPDNLATVRAGFAAMERGNLEAIVELLDPDVEFVNPDYAVEAGTRRGVEGYRGALRALMEIFAELRFELDDLIEVGDKVVVTGRFTAHGRGSGIDVGPQRFGSVLTIRDQKLVRHEWFREPAEAHAAVGGDRGSSQGKESARSRGGL